MTSSRIYRKSHKPSQKGLVNEFGINCLTQCPGPRLHICEQYPMLFELQAAIYVIKIVVITYQTISL
uniref:Uncharacterized protein n=1 Tax=Anguilla anguilla TaxID=7936 RepID=A0A0E9VZH8_ANGAN